MKFNIALGKVGYALASAAFVTSIGGLQASVALSAVELAQASPSAPTTHTPASAAPRPAPTTHPAPAAPRLAAPAPAAPAAPAASSTLSENPTFIGACRQVNRTTEIFQNTALGPQDQRIGSVTSGTKVWLTGVLGSGLAQIKTTTPTTAVGLVGWVSAANLTGCDTPPPPTDKCYIIKTSTAPNGLLAYTIPTSQPQTYNGKSDGPAGGSKVYLTSSSPQTVAGRTYVEVTYTSLSGNPRTGWISQGGGTPGSANSNLAPCN